MHTLCETRRRDGASYPNAVFTDISMLGYRCVWAMRNDERHASGEDADVTENIGYQFSS